MQLILGIHAVRGTLTVSHIVRIILALASRSPLTAPVILASFISLSGAVSPLALNSIRMDLQRVFNESFWSDRSLQSYADLSREYLTPLILDFFHQGRAAMEINAAESVDDTQLPQPRPLPGFFFETSRHVFADNILSFVICYSSSFNDYFQWLKMLFFNYYDGRRSWK